MRLSRMSELTTLSIEKASSMIRNGELSPRDLTRSCLDRIRQFDARFHCFITVLEESALAEAAQAEAEIKSGHWRGQLHGIPIALKDLLDTPGIRTTAASRVFEDRIPDTEAEVVRRLRAAGAVIIGKTNLHEFAYGCSSVITAFGEVHNPLLPEYIAGGSSSGSAAAVAAGMCLAAIGTDTAGSIRLPAAYCGVVGLKPTYDLVSRHGVVPLSWSNDHVGPITRTVADAAIVLHHIADEPFTPPAFGHINKSLRIRVARKYFFDELDPEIEVITHAALLQIESKFGSIADIAIEVDEDRTVQKAEAYAYHLPYLESSSAQYQPQTLERILSGRDISPLQYAVACSTMNESRNQAHRIFDAVDIVITPTCPIPPPRIDELLADPNTLRAKELLMLRNTRPFNVLGLPTISVPCGRTLAGLPVGLQSTAAHGHDALLLQFASAFEAIQT
jgi:aspartyl-tRNA(Asn)/glutamyl-tRNA(Gln) amidotransferase subunit A